MITDKQTNLVYLADRLSLFYRDFSLRLTEVFEECGIRYWEIFDTKDVWAVDFMPIQVTKDKMVQFVYSPDYLRGAKKYRKKISDVDHICTLMSLQPVRSRIVLDGGNVVRGENKVILCNKVFKENPSLGEKELIQELESLFEVDTIILVPQDPYDEIGHADGMVRFLDDQTVLINDYSREDKDFQLGFRSALYNAGLDLIEIPYNPYQNKTDFQANGCYINFLHTEQAVVVPVFGLDEDEKAVRQFEELFRAQTVISLDCNDIAKDGGVLNCITWNIFTQPKNPNENV